MASKFVMYQDNRGEWRWRLRDGNYRTTADSGEGYASKSNCKRAIENVKRDVPGADVEDSA